MGNGQYIVLLADEVTHNGKNIYTGMQIVKKYAKHYYDLASELNSISKGNEIHYFNIIERYYCFIDEGKLQLISYKFDKTKDKFVAKLLDENNIDEILEEAIDNFKSKRTKFY